MGTARMYILVHLVGMACWTLVGKSTEETTSLLFQRAFLWRSTTPLKFVYSCYTRLDQCHETSKYCKHRKLFWGRICASCDPLVKDLFKAQTRNLCAVQAGLISFVYVVGEWFLFPNNCVSCFGTFDLLPVISLCFFLAFACLFFWGCSYGLAGDESFFCMSPILVVSHCKSSPGLAQKGWRMQSRFYVVTTSSYSPCSNALNLSGSQLFPSWAEWWWNWYDSYKVQSQSG